jgi:glycosyltransferase involved in cell wall biosynthesis
MLKPFVQLMLGAALRGARSRLIVQNPDDGEQFVQHKLVDKGRVHLIRGSGVNTGHFTPKLQALARNPLKVLLATRLLWDKGVREYVEAARRLKGEGMELEFLLAGTGDKGNPASIPGEQIEAWAREGVVTLLGHVEDMRALLRNTDMVVLPSYREGVPRILIEAAACGLPIVATDVPGCREIVVHGRNGLLVPPHDAVSLASAIKHLAVNPQRRVEMGTAGRELTLKEFDERLIIAKTLAVYDKLLMAGKRVVGKTFAPTADSGGRE